MNAILHIYDPHTPATAGGKATALASALAAELPVPPWFVITPAAFCESVDAALAQQIQSALAALGGTRFAVRSSAVDEDGAEHSFAGQLESFLNVAAADVPQRVAEVWRSGFSERVLTYRRERGLVGPPLPPAVLVQRMVAADCAGVAFSADPVSSKRGVALVSAVRGLGESLVSGEADADTFHISRSGAVLSATFAKPETHVLTNAQAVAVAALAGRAETHFGTPQDIEWAIEGGVLFLLQSRPITTLAGRADPDGALRVWDNSNIAESYGGITTPLTFTFARRAYEEVYRQFCRIMRVPAVRIAENADTFRCMIGLLRGRVFYNLGSWYRVLSLLPGYAVNRSFMEQMMGVKEPLPDGAMPPAPATSGLAKLRDALQLAGSVLGLVVNQFTLVRQIAAFYARLNSALGTLPVPLEQMRSDELAAHYRDLERQLLTRWDAPLVNDFLAMIFHGVLRKLCTKWCGAESLANELIRDQGGIISAEPARRMKTLAVLAAPHPPLVAALKTGSLAAVRRTATPEFRRGLDEYLEKFGDRCLDELKLESPTLHDDATTLLQGIGAIAGMNVTQSVPAVPRATGETPVPLSGPRGFIFRWVLRNARDRVRDRENLRFERTRLFGRVRRIFVELGKRLTADGALAKPRDVFLLALDEVLGFCDGTAVSTDLRSLVELRRTEFGKWAAMPAPTDRCETRGTVNIGHEFQSTAPAPAPSTEGDQRQGLGCCAGIVRGPVRVVIEPRGASLEPGEILVAERTDPGWIMLFPSASGLLVERGSLLSHSAIVSRELGLPGIVSIPGITAWLKTGDLVEMDGSTGIVRRIST